jgi:hypothetical protein
MKSPLRTLVAAFLATCLAAALTRAAEPLLSSEEIRRLDRENHFWRALRVDEDVEANLARLRDLGASDLEIAAFTPKFAALWDVTYHREFGWLRPEQVDAIKAVDRRFVARLRAVRVRRTTGIALDPTARDETALAVTARWQRAVLRILEYDQLAEFRLMNSATAERTARHFENVPLTDDERRTLYEWQHDYELSAGPDGRKLRHDLLDVRLDHWRRIRDLIGDDRFAVYLASDEPNFARMHDALGEQVGSTTALDAWWIRERFHLALGGSREFGLSSAKLATRAESALRERLSEPLFAHYIASDDAKWVTGYRRQITGRTKK